MLFEFECPRCGQHIFADTSEEGRQGPCPSCQLLLTIPESRSFIQPSAAPYQEQRTQERRFSSYDECPAIYYRFNGKQEYGPQKLDGFVSFFAHRSDENIEGRFEDEGAWRPLGYFLELWDQVPPSGHTIERLGRAGISPEGLTESSGRKVLRDQQKSKPPTRRQMDYLRTQLAKSGDGLTRAEAEEIIREHDRRAWGEQQRLEEAPEIEACDKRLEQLKARVHELASDWTPPSQTDLNSLSCYVEVVENALDHATGFDLLELQSGPFFDGLDIEANYYLEFTRDPTPAELRGFQAALFRAYLEIQSEEFDHLTILRRTLPMIRVSLM
jgi:hypothetical protein